MSLSGRIVDRKRSEHRSRLRILAKSRTRGHCVRRAKFVRRPRISLDVSDQPNYTACLSATAIATSIPNTALNRRACLLVRGPCRPRMRRRTRLRGRRWGSKSRHDLRKRAVNIVVGRHDRVTSRRQPNYSCHNKHEQWKSRSKA